MKHKQRYTAFIERLPVNGIIWEEDGYFYLLQNTKLGACPNNMPIEYRASWCIGAGTERDLRHNSVTGLKFVKSNKTLIEELV